MIRYTDVDTETGSNQAGDVEADYRDDAIVGMPPFKGHAGVSESLPHM